MSDYGRENAWEALGRQLAAAALDEYRSEIESALHELSEALREGEEISPEHIQNLRSAMNVTQQLSEERLAPLAGAEPWNGTLNRVPVDAIYRSLGYRPTEGEPIKVSAGGTGD